MPVGQPASEIVGLKSSGEYRYSRANSILNWNPTPHRLGGPNAR